MNKLFLLMIVTLSFNSITYASFPITEDKSTQEIIVDNQKLSQDHHITNKSGNYQSGLSNAVISLCCGIIGLLVYPILFAPASIIFGILGLKSASSRRQRNLALTGLILGFIQLLYVVFVLIPYLLLN